MRLALLRQTKHCNAPLLTTPIVSANWHAKTSKHVTDEHPYAAMPETKRHPFPPRNSISYIPEYSVASGWWLQVKAMIRDEDTTSQSEQLLEGGRESLQARSST